MEPAYCCQFRSNGPSSNAAHHDISTYPSFFSGLFFSGPTSSTRVSTRHSPSNHHNRLTTLLWGFYMRLLSLMINYWEYPEQVKDQLRRQLLAPRLALFAGFPPSARF